MGHKNEFSIQVKKISRGNVLEHTHGSGYTVVMWFFFFCGSCPYFIVLVVNGYCVSCNIFLFSIAGTLWFTDGTFCCRCYHRDGRWCRNHVNMIHEVRHQKVIRVGVCGTPEILLQVQGYSFFFKFSWGSVEDLHSSVTSAVTIKWHEHVRQL